MPRYFFHVHDGRSILDKVGTELPDLATARQEAIALAGRMLLDYPEAFDDEPEWHVDVANADGLVFYSVLFATVTAPAGGAARRPREPVQRWAGRQVRLGITKPQPGRSANLR